MASRHVYGQVLRLGLTAEFRSDDRVKCFYRMFDEPALLPVDEVASRMSYLLEKIPDAEELESHGTILQHPQYVSGSLCRTQPWHRHYSPTLDNVPYPQFHSKQFDIKRSRLL